MTSKNSKKPSLRKVEFTLGPDGRLLSVAKWGDSKTVVAAVLLVAIGLSRGIYDLLFFPRQSDGYAWLAPRPRVFVNPHYEIEKKIVFVTESGRELSYDLKSEAQWPLADRLLLFHYTLIHCFDRPHLMDVEKWKFIVSFSACRPQNARLVLKTELLEEKILSVKAFVGRSSRDLRLAREVECSD